MSEEIRKILEAVARGEISPEEGEMLVNALLEKEEKIDFSKNSEVSSEKDFILERDEVVDGDLVLSKKKVIIKGKVRGDLALINCNTIFSGEVDGDLAVISGKVVFDGGRVKGDLALIGAKELGEKPVVEGEIAKISNFFIGGILKMIAPFIDNISVSSKKRKKEEIHGEE
ncbi:hypothetical protein [Thermotoga sp. KOL6]|uniref:hypothetical protein n=1 Tax=Thermotoga sp. KOL6 TaxID=126741 RepID=UPI000C76E3BC|nr:hypothetical protein [Thermotoga sp. KOL6]PLV59078.1 hypothetical protein AS005_04790 [Thermotoga sp. KOL6]